MTLRNVLKEHKTDYSVRVVFAMYSVEWGGKGIAHIVDRYKPTWLDMQVLSTTKDNAGRTIITIG